MTEGETYFQEKFRIIKNFKKAILLAIHGASTQFGKTLIQEQEVMNNISDMITETYISESTVLRVQKLESMNKEMAVFKAILDVIIYEASHNIRKAAFDAVHSFAAPELACRLKKVMDLLTGSACVNIKDARRIIADKLIKDNTYRF